MRKTSYFFANFTKRLQFCDFWFVVPERGHTIRKLFPLRGDPTHIRRGVKNARVPFHESVFIYHLYPIDYLVGLNITPAVNSLTCLEYLIREELKRKNK